MSKLVTDTLILTTSKSLNGCEAVLNIFSLRNSFFNIAFSVQSETGTRGVKGKMYQNEPGNIRRMSTRKWFYLSLK